MLRTFLLLSGAALLASTVVSQNQTATETRDASGVSETVFQTRAGKVKVYLPDDMAAGDTISGTVVAEPASAKDPKQEQKNASELSGYVLELGDNRTNTRDKHLHWKLPAKLSAATIDLLLTDGRGKPLGRSPIGVAPSPSSSGANFQIPNLTQAGRPVQIQGPFDGNSANTAAKLGGANLPVLAESPRQAIFQNPQTSPGVMPVAINENGVTANGTTRNIQINLHAEKLDLLRGEQTELRVTVNGLAGLAEKLPIRLTNENPEIVTLAGGNVQTLETSGNSTNDKEEFTRTLTGIKPGRYGLTTEMAKPEPIADVRVQLGQPSTQPTTTQPPSTQPSPTPPTTTPPTTTGTTPSTARPSPSPSPAVALPTSAPAPSSTPSATASGMPPLATRNEQTIPNVAVPAAPVTAVPNATPEKKENPCCKKIRDENGGGTRLIWRQGNNSFELKGNNLLLEIDGVRAVWKFDQDLEKEFCYSARYEIASEVKQVSETSLKDGKTSERQETTSLVFTGPDPGNQTSRPHKFFRFMASKLNNKAVKEYQVVLSVDEEKCTWMLSLFRDGELKEYLNRPPREPMDILDEMLRNLRRTHSGEQTYKHGDWWNNMYRMLGEIQQWLDWLDGRPDEGQRDKINEAYAAWRDNLKLALTNLQLPGTNVSSADKQTMNDLEKLLREDLPSREQLLEIRQKFNSLWEKFHESGVKF